MTKEENTETKVSKSKSKVTTKGKTSVIMGILTLLVIVSILLSAAVIYLGTKDLATWALTAPMVFWAGANLVKQFIK